MTDWQIVETMLQQVAGVVVPAVGLLILWAATVDLLIWLVEKWRR